MRKEVAANLLETDYDRIPPYQIDVSDFYDFARSGYCSFDEKGAPKVDYDVIFKSFNFSTSDSVSSTYSQSMDSVEPRAVL